MDKVSDRIIDFNIFYSSVLSILDKQLVETKFSVSEAKVLHQMLKIQDCTARKIMQELIIDEGYLSRIIERFSGLGLIRKHKSDLDKRANILMLTPKGKAEVQKLNKRYAAAVREFVKDISEKDIQLMLLMMEGIQNILGKGITSK